MRIFDNINNSEEEVLEESDLLFHSLNSLKNMEVIDIKTGSKIGYIKDFVLDIKESKIISILLPGFSKGWFSKEEDIEIPWESVVKAGVEVIIVDSSNIESLN